MGPIDLMTKYPELKDRFEDICSTVTKRSHISNANKALTALCERLRSQYKEFDILKLDMSYTHPSYEELVRYSGNKRLPPEELVLTYRFVLLYRVSGHDWLGCLVCVKPLSDEADFKLKKVVAQ